MLEIIELDGYMSIALDGKILVESSGEDHIEEMLSVIRLLTAIECSREVLDDDDEDSWNEWHNQRRK